jgi:hypothetical protein
MCKLLIISAGLSSTAMVNIFVVDVNDNFPVFNPATYNATVIEDAPIGTRIVLVSARDADAGRFGEIDYRITGGNEEGLFGLEANTGQILTQGHLASAITHRLVVTAYDGNGLASEPSVSP